MKNSRKVALEALLRIEEGAYSNLVLDHLLNDIVDKRDRALITEIVYGVLRNKTRLDHIISQLANRAINRIDLEVLVALRIGIYQLEFLDRIPGRAVVNETVNALKGLVNRGGIGFTNGVLRGYIRNQAKITYSKKPVEFLSVYYSHPHWLVKQWLEQYGYEKTESLLKINNQPPELNIRYNSLNVGLEEFKEKLTEANIMIKTLPVPEAFILNNVDKVSNLPLFKNGGLIIQGAAAVLAGHILNPQPGMRVLDMAAGPGGKTTHLAQLMTNKGEIIALDIFDHKIELIKDNCRRLGVNIVHPVKADGSKYNSVNLFDMILVDAPCSGLGLIRQKPEIKWNKRPVDIRKLAQIQLKMLNQAVKLLRPGGKLLYSTCTLTREENQGLIQQFRENNRDSLEQLDITEDLKRLKLNDLYLTDRVGNLELFPPEHETEGFFMAKFRIKP